MKTLYYTILMRPIGSTTWTPLDIALQERNVGNYFASKTDARSYCDLKAKVGLSFYLPGPKKIVGTELNVASVVIDDDVPTVICQPPMVELS